MDNLNTEQLRAATFSGKHLLVLAGAGTGKTRTIIARAKHLIQHGVQPKRILILSFTRKSAKEIVDRIHNELPEMQAEGLQGQTFHSWCMSIIKNHPNIFPQAEYTLLDEEDQVSCFRLLCGKKWTYHNDNHKIVLPKDICNVNSYCMNAQCSLSDAIRMKLYDNAPADKDVSKDKSVLEGVIRMYQEYKSTRHYIDYDDIIHIVSQYLKKHEEIRRAIAGLYDHILIDEMQDTNPLQYELLSSFYDSCHLFCVGDDAQSIYSFRGADFHTIHNFTTEVPNSELCKLTLNYRSSQEILDLSNWIIANSPLQYDKELTAFRGSGEKPTMVHWGDEWEEANDITNHIIEALKIKGKKYSDNLILSRTVYGMKKIEAQLISNKIPYRIFGGSGLFSSKHIRDLVAAMRIVSNYLDELAWSRYLQLWNNVGEVKTAQIIDEILKGTDLDDCLMILMESVNSRKLEEEIYNTLIEISNLQFSPASAIKGALKIMSKRLQHIYKNDGWERRKKDFVLLEEVAKNVGSINEFVAEYILDPKVQLAVKLPGKDLDCVTLSTIHSAKGLEADIVYLINASTNSYPTNRAILNGENAIEEERRCLYVALTRAKDELRIYRDIHSVQMVHEDQQYYFFNNLPEHLCSINNIAANYCHFDKSDISGPIEENIYADFNFD